MNVLRRIAAALSASFVLISASGADAQTVSAFLVGPTDSSLAPAPDQRNLPQFRMPAGDFREAGRPRRNGLIAAVPLRENLQIGVGRFTVPELARPRTHMESDRAPTAVRMRDRGVAAIGLSVRF